MAYYKLKEKKAHWLIRLSNWIRVTTFSKIASELAAFTVFAVLIGFLGFVVIGLFAIVILGVDAHLEFWLSYIKQVPVTVPLWISVVLCLVADELVFGLLILSIIVRSVM